MTHDTSMKLKRLQSSVPTLNIVDNKQDISTESDDLFYFLVWILNFLLTDGDCGPSIV